MRLKARVMNSRHAVNKTILVNLDLLYCSPGSFYYFAVYHKPGILLSKVTFIKVLCTAFIDWVDAHMLDFMVCLLIEA